MGEDCDYPVHAFNFSLISPGFDAVPYQETKRKSTVSVVKLGVNTEEILK
jgi:hypothetical protein